MKIGIKKILSNKFSFDTLILIVAQIIFMLAAFGINILIGYYRGIIELGLFNQALAVYMLFSTLTGFGLNMAIIKKIGSNPRDKLFASSMLSSTLITTVVLSIIFVVFLYISLIYFPFLYPSKELVEILLSLIIAIPVFNVNKNFAAFYTGKSKQSLFALNRIIRWISIFSFISFSIYTNQNLNFFFYSLLLSEVILLIFNLFFLINQITYTLNIELIKANLNFGIKSYITEIISAVNSYGDLIILGYFLTQSNLGVYSFIIFFAKTLYIFPGILMQNINPTISKLWERNERIELQKRINKIRVLNIKVILIQLIFLIITYLFVISILKQEFHGTLWLLIVVVIGFTFKAIINYAGAIFTMTGKLRENFYRMFSIVVINVVLLSIMSFFLGLEGAIFGSSLSALFSFLIMIKFSKRSLGISIF